MFPLIVVAVGKIPSGFVALPATSLHRHPRVIDVVVLDDGHLLFAISSVVSELSLDLFVVLHGVPSSKNVGFKLGESIQLSLEIGDLGSPGAATTRSWIGIIH